MLTGHCVDQQGAQPYLPTLEHLEEAARQGSPEAFRRALGENAPEIAKLMPELRVRYSDIPDPVSLPPEQERRHLLHGIAEFLERNARATPLLLVFEDLQWADESTLLLVRQIAQRVAQIPVLAVGTYRDTDLKPDSALAATLPSCCASAPWRRSGSGASPKPAWPRSSRAAPAARRPRSWPR